MADPSPIDTARAKVQRYPTSEKDKTAPILIALLDKGFFEHFCLTYCSFYVTLARHTNSMEVQQPSRINVAPCDAADMPASPPNPNTSADDLPSALNANSSPWPRT